MKRYHYNVRADGRDVASRITDAIPHGSRVLEVGCASGVQSRLLKDQLACKVTGMELDPHAAEEAKPFCDEVIVGDVETLDYRSALADKRFDVILLADVLEHLRSPQMVLSRLKPYLRNEGFILASIPNIVHAALILEMVKGRFDYRPFGLLDDTHLRFFTKKSIFELFEQSGLSIQDLARVERQPEETEFFSHPYSAWERDVLDHIRRQNSEWATFQFVVKAIPASVPARTTHALLAAEDLVKDLEDAKAALQANNRRLQSQLQWLESRPWYRAMAYTRKLLTRK